MHPHSTHSEVSNPKLWPSGRRKDRKRVVLKLLVVAKKEITLWNLPINVKWPAPGLDDTQLSKSGLPLELHRA
jgi:hypothetical protein